MADSVGKISLDLELQGDLTKQINEAANKIGEQLKGSLQGINFKEIAESLSSNIKKSMESTMKGIQESLERTINKAISGATSASRKIKVPVNYDIPSNSAAPKVNTLGNAISPRAPPKVSSGVNFEAIKAQIDNLTQSLDITNAKIEQQKIKLQGLKEAYATAFNGTQKNKIQERILQTEATINRLTAASDKAGFKLADLDLKFTTLDEAAKKAGTGIGIVNDKLNQTSRGMKNLSNSTNTAGRSFGYSRNSLSMFINTMFKWGIIFPIVSKGIFAVAGAIGSSLMVNSQFANSLLQIKTNLEVAFMPIYQAVLPAINALMRGLSTVTAYIAAFVSVLFGKTYQASYGAAKSLNTSIAKMKETGTQSKKTASDIKKAAKDATGALAGFDEINQLKMSTPAAIGATPSSGGGVSVPSMAVPSVDLSSQSAAISKISSIVQGLKNVLATVFKPFKIGWDTYGASIMANIKGTISNIVSVFKSIGTAIAEVWGARGQGIVNTFYGLLQTGSMILNVVSKFMKDVWDNGGQYCFKKMLEFGASLIKLAGTINERFVQPLIKWFADNIEPILAKAIGGVNKAVGYLFSKLTDLTDWLSGDGKGALDIIIIVLGSFALAWGAVTLAMNIASIAVGAWNIICGIGATITGIFGAAVAFLTSPIGIAILAIGTLIAIGILLYKNWDTVAAFLKNCWNGIKTTASVVWNAIVTTIKNVFIGIGAWFSSVFTAAWNGIKSAFSAVGTWFGNVFTGAWNGIKRAFSGVGSFFKGVWNTIKSMFTSIGSTIGNAIGGAFKYVINSIIGFAQNTINGFIRGVNKAINLINAIPGVNIRTLSTLNIPRLAKGGILDQPTLAMVGEAGKEAVMPLENNTGWIDTLAGKLNSKGQSSDEVVKLLQIIIDILKSLDLDIDIDGDNFGKAIIKRINKLQHQAGRTLINV